MKLSTTLPLVLLQSLGALTQSITIPAVDGSLPAAGPNGCAEGYYPGTDTVLYTVPYTYQQVLSIIGDYSNLTWSGSPAGSVTLNGTDNTVGTARFYDIAGAHLIETITEYSKPANGPYVEVHTLAPLTLPTFNVSLYGDFDGQVWEPICGGKATTTNFTINFCATNATLGAQLLHMFHLTDAETVGTFLGGDNFTSCAALGGGAAAGRNATGVAGGASGNATMTGSPAMFTGAATNVGLEGSIIIAAVAAVAAGLMF